MSTTIHLETSGALLEHSLVEWFNKRGDHTTILVPLVIDKWDVDTADGFTLTDITLSRECDLYNNLFHQLVDFRVSLRSRHVITGNEATIYDWQKNEFETIALLEKKNDKKKWNEDEFITLWMENVLVLFDYGYFLVKSCRVLHDLLLHSTQGRPTTLWRETTLGKEDVHDIVRVFAKEKGFEAKDEEMYVFNPDDLFRHCYQSGCLNTTDLVPTRTPFLEIKVTETKARLGYDWYEVLKKSSLSKEPLLFYLRNVLTLSFQKKVENESKDRNDMNEIDENKILEELMADVDNEQTKSGGEKQVVGTSSSGVESPPLHVEDYVVLVPKPETKEVDSLPTLVEQAGSMGQIVSLMGKEEENRTKEVDNLSIIVEQAGSMGQLSPTTLMEKEENRAKEVEGSESLGERTQE